MCSKRMAPVYSTQHQLSCGIFSHNLNTCRYSHRTLGDRLPRLDHLYSMTMLHLLGMLRPTHKHIHA